MEPRNAFKIFIQFQLQQGIAQRLGLSEEDVEKFISGVEDDPIFYDKLDEFIEEFIEDFGENYGIEL